MNSPPLRLVFRFRVLCCLLGAVLYVLSPLDIIPVCVVEAYMLLNDRSMDGRLKEAVFGVLGILDDVFILFLLAIYLTAAYRTFVANQD